MTFHLTIGGKPPMARCACECGNILSNSRMPNEIQYYTFSPSQWETLLTPGETDVLAVPDPEGEIWLCPRRERFLWFPVGSDQAQSFRKVSERPFSGDYGEDSFHVFSDIQRDELLRSDWVDFAKTEIQPFLLEKNEKGFVILNPVTRKESVYQREKNPEGRRSRRPADVLVR